MTEREKADGGSSTDVADETILVLHVDDEPDFGDLVADFLERLAEDITVITETDPTVVLDRLSTRTVDCIISDYQMPEMDGVELLRAVRMDYPNLPFFLFTGKGSEDVATDAIDAGVTSYIQKGGPEVYEQLANRITNAMKRRRSERTAKVATDRLLALYEQTDGFYILEEDWTISYWNQHIATRTGLPSEDVVGRKFWDVFPEATETEVYDHLQATMANEEPAEFETYYEPLGYWAEVRAFPVEDGLFIHSRDISEEREQEQELKRRNQILESFANTVSHDLRNPLNLAQGKLQLAQETGDFDHLEGVAQAHNRMRNLIDELLRLARGEELAQTEVELRSAAKEAWETVSSGAVNLAVEGSARFEAHDTQLRRLFENLYWNAIDHGEATAIRVGVLDEGGFYVEDDGVGIPASDRARVFESGVSTGDDSPGYGLSIVMGIVETHGWEVSITESEDGGARFEFRGVSLIERG